MLDADVVDSSTGVCPGEHQTHLVENTVNNIHTLLNKPSGKYRHGINVSVEEHVLGSLSLRTLVEEPSDIGTVGTILDDCVS